MNKYFMTPEEYEKLIEKEKSSSLSNEFEMDEYFKPAGELDSPTKKESEQKNAQLLDKNLSEEKVKEFLTSISSGKSYPGKSELGIVCSGGIRLVSIVQLIDMVNQGNYNIISAKYINNEVVEIKFQELLKDCKEEYKKQF